MKLTNVIRDAFVRAVMDDVPSIDYDTQIRELVMKKAVARLPKKIQDVWKDESTRPFVAIGCMYFKRKPVAGLPGIDEWRSWLGEEPPKEWYADIEELVKLEGEQNEERNKLEYKVRAVAYSCTTRKQLLEQMPEFEKYLPAEAVKSAGLPAMANLVTDLVKAGWPKGGNEPEAVAA